MKSAPLRSTFATLSHSKSDVCTGLPLTAPQKASAMGIRLPTNSVDGPLTAPPSSVVVTLTGITLCTLTKCLPIIPPPDPWRVFLPAAPVTPALFQAVSHSFQLNLWADLLPNHTTLLRIEPLGIAIPADIFFSESASGTPYTLSLANQLSTCSPSNCGFDGFAAITLQASASAVAASVGVPPANDRMYEPFITQSGAAVYRYASRSLRTNVIVETED